MLGENGHINELLPSPGETRRKWSGGVYIADDSPSCHAGSYLHKSVEDPDEES